MKDSMAHSLCYDVEHPASIDRMQAKGRDCHMTIEAHLATLEKKHGVLEQELHSALTQPSAQDVHIADIKRRKLRLKDEIQKIRSSTH
jgi:hypothetical protein